MYLPSICLTPFIELLFLWFIISGGDYNSGGLIGQWLSQGGTAIGDSFVTNNINIGTVNIG